MTRRIPFLLLVALLALLVSPAALALQRTFDEPVAACDLTGTPASVVVDVYDALAPGVLLGTIPNGEVDQVAATNCFVANLATTTAPIAYPDSDDPAERHYIVIFRDDAANERRLAVSVIGFAGGEDRSCTREVFHFASSAIPSRGLTLALINAGKPSYHEIQVDCTRGFSPPWRTVYYVPIYNANGTLADYTVQDTPPSP